MKKTKKEGIYIRELSNDSISYIITYRINGYFYKRRLGTDKEGWTVQLAHKERLRRIVEDKKPDSIKEKLTLDSIANDYFLSISHKSEYKNSIGKYTNHIKGVLGHKLIKDITVSNVNTLKQELSQKLSIRTGKLLAPKTVNDLIDLLNTIYSYYNRK